MPRLFVLVKRAGSKSWQVAIPARAGVSRARLVKVISRSRKRGYMYKIVGEAQVRALMAKRTARRARTRRRARRPTYRRTRRRTTRRRRR